MPVDSRERVMQYAMVFQYENSRDFRTFDIDGEPWFALVDVCRALDIKNASDVSGRLDADEKMTLDLTEGHSRSGRGGARALTVINESGLYSVILTARFESHEAGSRLRLG